MRIVIRSLTEVPDETEALLRRQLAFALSRSTDHVRSVTVRMDDQNGPRGGIDKSCMLVIRLVRSPHLVVIEDTGSSHALAVGRAIARAGRVVARAVQRSSQWGRLQPQY